MRVCKYGCGVKMFCFSRANHASTSLKTFLSSKLDKFTLFTHSFVGWNFENRYKEGVSIFLRLSWHFKRENSLFWKASFCKTRTDYECKSRVCITVSISPNPSRVYIRLCKHGKLFLLLKCKRWGTVENQRKLNNIDRQIQKILYNLCFKF